MKVRSIGFITLFMLIAPTHGLAGCDPFSERDAAKTITQGEFAVLMAQALDLDRPKEWQCSHAVDLLKKHAIVPDGGWKLDKALTEEVMVEVVRQVGLQISTSAKDSKVTWGTAKVVIAQIARLMVRSEGKLLRNRAKTFEIGRPLTSPTEP